MATAVALTLDQSISLWFDEPQRNAWRMFCVEITDVGKAEQWFALALLVYIICRFLIHFRPKFVNFGKIQNIRHWAAHFFLALIVSGLSVHVVKFLFGRQRPHISLTRDAFTFHPFTFDWNYQSLASGHTQTLFCVATMFATLWPKSAKWFWFLAAVFSFTRVMAIQHFTSDIIVGAMIGYYGTKWSLLLFSSSIPIPHAITESKNLAH